MGIEDLQTTFFIQILWMNEVIWHNCLIIMTDKTILVSLQFIFEEIDNYQIQRVQLNYNCVHSYCLQIPVGRNER
jgi:hypothetical protein